MAIKPILFNTEMVRAILDGRKSCTRRIVKHDVEAILNSPYHKEHPEVEDEQIISKLCIPPYQPGDILYVRETWQYLYELDGNEQIIEGTGKYYYAATDTIPFDTYVDASGVTHERVPWHPSIHMPKEAARIWLKVTNVRVERLQEITPQGAWKEGARCSCLHPVPDCAGNKTAFVNIWNSTIKKSDIDRYGWDANPWVWVIEFEQCEKPKGEN
ncbi:MAG: hypothetical protein KH381_01965 [Clostridium sp.]|nr:hypothetical protein [Clostridium sp.]